MQKRTTAIAIASLLVLAGCGAAPTALRAPVSQPAGMSASAKAITVAAPPNTKTRVRQANFDVFDPKKESLADISNVVAKSVTNSWTQQHFFFEFDIKVGDKTEKRMMTATFAFNANRIFVEKMQSPKAVTHKELARVFRLALESDAGYAPEIKRVLNDMVLALASVEK